MFFELKEPSFEANLVLSTLNPGGDDASTISAHEIKQSMRKRAAGKKTSRQATKSLKRPSIRANKSVNDRTRESSILDRTNSPNVSIDRSLVVGGIDTSTSEMNNVHLSGIRNPEMRNNSTEKNQTRENIRERPGLPGVSPICGTSTSKNCSPVVSSLGTLSSRTTEPSIFSPNWKKQSKDKADDNSDQIMEVDEIPASPPPPVKKARMIFKKCYQATFDPRMLVGHDSILADDSDEET